MNAYPYMAPDPAATRAKDESDLNLLSILHYVWTGLFGCSAFGLVAYFIAIAGVVAAAPPSGPHSSPHDQEVVAGVVGIIGIVMGIIMIPLFVLHLLAAAGLKKRARYTLILVVSGLACLSFPLGTALGVFTFIVMMRPGVKALFGRT